MTLLPGGRGAVGGVAGADSPHSGRGILRRVARFGSHRLPLPHAAADDREIVPHVVIALDGTRLVASWLDPMNADPELCRIAERLVGHTLCGKWHVDRLLDMGGMAAVYVATHRNGNRVAIKMLHPTYATTPNVRERFLREGYLANKVKHPASVNVLDDDTTENGDVFLVMELLEGQSMEALLQRSGGVLSVQHVLAIADQTLDVLQAAHTAGVIHRDIKPGNLFLTRQGQVKVLDFGLAKLKEADPSTHLTGVGVVMGTSSYMPPEQARSNWKVVDGRTDLFALGAVMFRALSGRVVHLAETPTDRLLAAMSQPAVSLGVVAPRLAKPIVDVVDRSLRFAMEERWKDASTMQVAVRHAFALLSAHPDAQARLCETHGPPSFVEPSNSSEESATVHVGRRRASPGTQTSTTVAERGIDNLGEVSVLLVEGLLTEADRLP